MNKLSSGRLEVKRHLHAHVHSRFPVTKFSVVKIRIIIRLDKGLNGTVSNQTCYGGVSKIIHVQVGNNTIYK